MGRGGFSLGGGPGSLIGVYNIFDTVRLKEWAEGCIDCVAWRGAVIAIDGDVSPDATASVQRELAVGRPKVAIKNQGK